MSEAQSIANKIVIPKHKLVPWTGAAARLGEYQIAVFFLPDSEPRYFAIDHCDPFSQANVLAHGIVGDVNGEPMVASPLYKQRFSLLTGQCFDDPEVSVGCYPILNDDEVLTIEL